MKIQLYATKNNKQVVIIAKTEEGKFIVRYQDDIDGKHRNRAYMYDIDEIDFHNNIYAKIILQNYKGQILNEKGILLDAMLSQSMLEIPTLSDEYEVCKKFDAKPVVVKAINEERVVIRFKDDIAGNHRTRCYLYNKEELVILPKQDLIEDYVLVDIYDLIILDDDENEIETLSYKKYPSDKEIIKQLLKYEGTMSSIKKVKVLC